MDSRPLHAIPVFDRLAFRTDAGYRGSVTTMRDDARVVGQTRALTHGMPFARRLVVSFRFVTRASRAFIRRSVLRLPARGARAASDIATGKADRTASDA